MPEIIPVQRMIFDPDIVNFAIEDTGKDVVGIVESILDGNKLPFVVYHKPHQTSFHDIQYRRDQRAMVGYGGERTFPFISDPTEHFSGAVGIFDGKLIYSLRGCPLHLMRDSYTYAAQSLYYHNFFIDGDFLSVVANFNEAGYPIHFSPNMVDYQRKLTFEIHKEISI